MNSHDVMYIQLCIFNRYKSRIHLSYATIPMAALATATLIFYYSDRLSK